MALEDVEVGMVGVGTAAIIQAGEDKGDLVDMLCSITGYPYDLVIPGMVASNMLEFCASVGSPKVMLKLMKNWRRALASMDPSDGKQLPPAMHFATAPGHAVLGGACW
jgi:hypothetical protein